MPRGRRFMRIGDQMASVVKAQVKVISWRIGWAKNE
jgi:hypothetical protein